MNKYKVAIITRTKNRTILLERAINSVLSQTLKDWIMVIVNDGGVKEDVDKLVDKYKDKHNDQIKVIHNDTSLGMEAASNKGIKGSNSEYVIIHDDDDSWKETFLERCVDFLENTSLTNFKGVITYSTRILERIQNGKVTIEYKEPYNTWLNTGITLYRMAASNVFPPISFLYKREVFDEIGYYRESLPVLGDWEFNLRFLAKYDIYVIEEELANYHHRLESKNGDYSNSVIGGHNKHVLYDSILRNELLRDDMKNNKVGLGYLINISKSFEILHGQIGVLEKFLNKLKRSNFLRKIFKKFISK